ncbi:MAG: metal ABC transporter permease [Spirochaetales bacterium]|nr:metal ABC transporter permease [Spirochaetales bacterium]
MIVFFRDLFIFDHVQYAVIGAVLASLSCGIMGSYLSVRRITSSAGAISHFLLGGLAAAQFLKKVYLVPIPVEAGALVAAVIAAVIIWLVTRWAKQREDTVLSVLWAFGMAVGGIFIFFTPGNTGNLQFYLFGDMSLINPSGLAAMGILAAVLILFFIFFYEKILAIAFDSEYAALRGIRVSMYSFLLLLFAALTVVVVVQLVGIVMAIALLSLPQAIAATFTRRLWQLIAGSIILSMIFTVGGFAASYEPGTPPGAMIILSAGFFYLVSLALKSFRKNRRTAQVSGAR